MVKKKTVVSKKKPVIKKVEPVIKEVKKEEPVVEEKKVIMVGPLKVIETLDETPTAFLYKLEDGSTTYVQK